MKHTAGPWRIETAELMGKKFIDSDNFGTICQFIYDPPGTLIAEEAAANARLIAASPDLLEALKGLFEHCAVVHKHWGDNGNQQEASDAIRKACAAIQKAEGE
jgi:hypothetical protein